MERYNRAYLRFADRFCQSISCKPSDTSDLDPPTESWHQVADCFRRLRLARERGWQAPTAELTRRLQAECRYLINRLQSAVERANALLTSRPRPRVSDVFRELVALDEEFDEVECDVAKGTLAVTTAPITLEDFQLGRFQIVLELEHVHSYSPYCVIAQQPNPAAKSESITHPHVRDEHLCEGRGHDAIRAALEGGRLHDFFLLVSQVLHTYARGEAYAELDDWGGVRCADCDTVTSEATRRECPECEARICEDCGCDCQSCNQDFCQQCSARCGGCREWNCSACLRECPGCHNSFCPSCFERDLCVACYEDDCHDDDESQDAAADQAVVVPPADAAVQPHGLGQAAVPA